MGGGGGRWAYERKESIIVGCDKVILGHLSVLAGEITRLAGLWGGSVTWWLLATDVWVKVSQGGRAVARGVDWGDVDVVCCLMISLCLVVVVMVVKIGRAHV